MSPATTNLIDNREATVTLLAEPLGWKVRVVEELTVDSATSCRRKRSAQIAPLRDTLAPFLPRIRRTSHALVAMPIAPMPRGPLLDFDVTGPSGSGWLLPRVEIAIRETMYLKALAASCDYVVSDSLTDLLSAILGFTGEWFQRDLSKPTWRSGGLKSFLEDGIGQAIGEDVLRRWEQYGRDCKQVLRPRIDVFRGYSAPEEPALALPELFASGSVPSLDRATKLLAEYRDLITRIEELARSQRAPGASEFLDALADYANSYDLVVAMQVPLDEPFLVKFAERRDLRLSAFSNNGEQELVIADAQTNHVTFKIVDPNVRIASFYAKKPDMDDFAYGAFQSREDLQNRAFYAHDPDRDYRIRLTFKLNILRRLQLVPYFASALLVLLTAALLIQQPHDLRTLAIVVGPVALAASVLLAREPSTLGSRLRLLSSLVVAAGLAALIVVAVTLYLVGAHVTAST